MSIDRENKVPAEPEHGLVHESTDGHGMWKPQTRYEERFRKQQTHEGWYMFFLIMCALVILAIAAFRIDVGSSRNIFLYSAGGLLGGTVYGGKWLYHAVAKGLWHEDRKLWRYLSPWISLGTTVGIGALIDAGFFQNMKSAELPTNSSTLIGMGFLIGYFSDKALAKMKDLTEVLFGETRSRFDDGDGLEKTSRKK